MRPRWTRRHYSADRAPLRRRRPSWEAGRGTATGITSTTRTTFAPRSRPSQLRGAGEPAALDVVAATGELLSSRLFAAAHGRARPSRPPGWTRVTVSSTDDRHTCAAPLAEETNAACRAVLGPLVERAVIPVLGGFIGRTPDGSTTTLGRGGSDYSASLVGAAIGAAEIQIWTDVDGMLTADPADRLRRRGRRATCRSPRQRSWHISAPRCCTRARSFRRFRGTFRSAS